MQEPDLGELGVFLDVSYHGASGDGVIGPHTEQPGIPLLGDVDIGGADYGGDAIVLDGIRRGKDLCAIEAADQGQLPSPGPRPSVAPPAPRG